MKCPERQAEDLTEERQAPCSHSVRYFRQAQTETSPTLHLFRHKSRPYHVDYVFIPREWMFRLRAVEVGEYEQWSKLSDDCPVVVDIV